MNNLENGRVRSCNFLNAPEQGRWLFVSSFKENLYTYQEAVALVDDKNKIYRRVKIEGEWGQWREQAGDKSVIDTTISQLTARVTTLEEKVAQLQGGS